MEAEERQLLVRRLRRAYPMFQVEELYEGVRVHYETPTDDKKRARLVWIQASSWETVVEQIGAFASEWGFLPIDTIPRPLQQT